jgi:hypothetical protein
VTARVRQPATNLQRAGFGEIGRPCNSLKLGGLVPIERPNGADDRSHNAGGAERATPSKPAHKLLDLLVERAWCRVCLMTSSHNRLLLVLVGKPCPYCGEGVIEELVER